MRILGVLIVVLAVGFGVVQLFADEGDEPEDAGGTAGGTTTDEGSDESGANAKRAVNEERFHAALKSAAAIYKGWGRVDDEARWAPWLCRRPNPSAVRFSESSDTKTHGRKLYWLYAKEHTDYTDKFDVETPVPVGQVIVKESWEPEPIEAMPETPDDRTNEKAKIVSDGEVQVDWAEDSIHRRGETVMVSSYIKPYVEKDGKAYRAKEVRALFIMLKLDPKTEGTDAGWVYGTLTADGKTVTSAGKVASCMKCHKDAKRERLFGLAE